MRAYPSLARLESLELRGMKLGLTAIDTLCERLGRPERRIPSVLVGGTNGKGSTAATLSAIAKASGVRAGLYTSPHLIHVTERIRVEEEDVTAEELDRALETVFAAAEEEPRIPATYFEAATAAAFLIFFERRLELAILEVGLGGRFDATNVAPALLSAVTSVGIDHTEELGPTLSHIAREKAGIFRAGRPALVRAPAEEAREVLRAEARDRGSAWHDAGAEISVRVLQTGVEGTCFELTTPLRRARLATPLPGSHQAWNAALAIRAAELLPEIPLILEGIEAGLAAVRWPGRLERFEIAGRAVLLDGCHNAEGAAALAGFLSDSGLEGRCHLLFGAMADKDIEGIAGILFPAVERVTLVAVSSPRAASAQELAGRVPSAPGRVSAGADVKEALETLLAAGGRAPIIVAGSLYLVGEARAFLLGARRPEGRK
jgi:dihydrofolate synthase / folylpolyglutamate synthase